MSSLHMTFMQQDEAEALHQEGFLRRTGIQYHWCEAAAFVLKGNVQL